MTVIGRLKSYLYRALSLSDAKAWDPSLWQTAGAQSLSGETVTETTALTYSAVYAAVQLIAGTIGALPLHLMQAKGPTKRLADERLLYSLLHDAPNPYMTAMAFREAMLAHILVWGNGYAEIVRNELGDIVQLWPITPNRVTPAMDGSALVYRITMPGAAPAITLPRARVLHIPGLGFDGFLGYSVIAMARKSLGLAMALETFGAQYFGQGTHPGVVVKHPNQLSAQAHTNLRNDLTEKYSGLGNSHRLLLLEEGMTVEKLGIPPEDSQFLESRQFSVTEVARWFNLPPHKLKDLTRSSFSNIESEQRSFYADSLLPWLVRLEQNYNLQLLTRGDRMQYGGGRLYFKHSAEGILRADAAGRGEFYAKMFGIGALSVNEIRALEDLDPIAGGDLHLVPLNMTTLENAGKPQDPQRPRMLPAPDQEDDPAPSNGNGNGTPARRGAR